MKKSIFYGITLNVILLGMASLFTDLSSEILIPLIPLFMSNLGAPVFFIGILGGISDLIVSMVHFFSGYWSDLTGKRKRFVFIGYSISASMKLAMSLATSWIHIFILRPIERIGKGLREPPRDAILAETTPKKVHGKIFGIHRAFDTAGAIMGSILAAFFLALGLTYNKIFLIAAIISFISLIPLFFVKEKKIVLKKGSLNIRLKNIPKNLKKFIFVSTIFALANFSYMFFILRAQQFFSSFFTVLLYIIFNISYWIFAIPAGMWADKIGKKRILILGYILFTLVCLNFVFANSFLSFYLGFIFYGISHAFIVGNQRALAADLAKKRIGTGIGAFHMFISLAALPAGVIAGLLWNFISPEATFIFGALVALISAIVFILIRLNEK
ncbi:MAG: MFS transporter [Candidatus Pacearchaeota archaeon]